MRCPYCGATVSDNDLLCPKCHSQLTATTKLPKLGEKYCPSCGAILSPFEDVCPRCGMWIKDSKMNLPVVGVAGSKTMSKLNSTAKMESAIPSIDDAQDSDAHGDSIHMRSVVISALAVVLIIGGGLLFFFHPWEPDIVAKSNQAPANTSMEGFPGTIERLSTQDKNGLEDEENANMSIDMLAYTTLNSAYSDLSDIKDAIDSNYKDLQDIFEVENADIEKGMADAKKTSIALSNLISSVEQLAADKTQYVDKKDELIKMSNWLRNASDVIVSAWNSASESNDLTEDKDSILGSVESKGIPFEEMFKKALDAYQLDAPKE